MDSSLLNSQFQDMKKLDRFNGTNYKPWSMKIMCMLTIAKMAYVVTDLKPTGTNENPTVLMAREATDLTNK